MINVCKHFTCVLKGWDSVMYERGLDDYSYRSICVKRPLQKDEPKILMSNGSLMKRMLGAFCNTFDLY